MTEKESGSARALVLFDIDGTLIRRAGPHHRQALADAIRRVTGLETTTDGIPLHGMLDPDIVAEMLRNAGARARLIREAMPEIVATAQSLYVRRCPDLGGKLCPGVRRLLGRLVARGAALALVTGNLTRIGWKKMERAGLKPYFRFGAFGEMGPDRAGLVRLALREARRRGLVRNGTPVSLIGDSPNDVRAAQAAGVRSIAVATGISDARELRACSPDWLLEDLRRLRLEMLL